MDELDANVRTGIQNPLERHLMHFHICISNNKCQCLPFYHCVQKCGDLYADKETSYISCILSITSEYAGGSYIFFSVNISWFFPHGAEWGAGIKLQGHVLEHLAAEGVENCS